MSRAVLIITSITKFSCINTTRIQPGQEPLMVQQDGCLLSFKILCLNKKIEPNSLPCSHNANYRIKNRPVVFILPNFQNYRKLTNHFNPTFEWCWDQSELIQINPNQECSHMNYNSNQPGLMRINPGKKLCVNGMNANPSS